MADAHLVIRVNLDRLYHLLLALTLVGVGIIVVALVGEYLGWWREWGETLAIIGVVITVGIGALTLLVGATRGQVKLMAAAVLDSNRKQDVALAKHDETNAKLDEANAKLDDGNAKLDGANAKLDGVNGKLDEHTHLLREQTEILRQIRDRPGP